MAKLNYINLKNRNNEKQNSQKIIEEMFNEYINIVSIFIKSHQIFFKEIFS